jgi:hypothetical protein
MSPGRAREAFAWLSVSDSQQGEPQASLASLLGVFLILLPYPYCCRIFISLLFVKGHFVAVSATWLPALENPIDLSGQWSSERPNLDGTVFGNSREI